MMATVIQQIQEPLPETLSPKLLTEHHLMPLTEALWNIHFPTNPDVLRRAQYRLKFEELFYVQLNILRYAKDRQKRYRGYIFEKVGDVFNTFYTKNLPFQLTGAQKRVLKEITERCRQWQTDESPFAGRCRKRKNTGCLDEYVAGIG